MRYIRAVISKSGVLDKAIINFFNGINVIKDLSGFVSVALVDCLWRSEKLKFINEEELHDTDVEIDISLNKKTSYNVIQKQGEFSIYSNTGIREFFRYGVGLEYICEEAIEKMPKPLRSFLKNFDAKKFISSSYLPKANLKTTDFEALNHLIVDDGSGYLGVYKNLHENFLKDAQNRKVIKSINEIEKNIKELSKKNEIFKIKSERYSKLKDEEVLINKEILKLEKKLSKLKKNEADLSNVLQKVKKYSSISQEINEITALLEEYKSRQEEIDLLQNEIEKNYKKFADYGVVEDDNIAKLQNLFGEYRKIHNEIEKIYDKIFRTKRHIKRGVFYLFVISWITAFILFAMGTISLIESILIGIIPIPVLILAIMKNKRLSKNTSLEECFAQRAKIKSELEKLLMIENIAEYDCNFEGLFQILMRHFDDFLEYSDKKNEIEGIAVNMNSDEDINKFKKKVNQLKKKRKELKQSILAELSDNFPAGLNDFDEKFIIKLINGNDEEIKSIIEKIEEKTQIGSNIAGEMKDERDYSQEIEAVDIEIMEAEKKLQILTKKKETIYAFIESLGYAVESVNNKKYKKLMTESLNCFHTLTRGVYNQIDEKTIDSLLKAEDKYQNEYSELSDEVKYCILLSVKLKLTDFLIDSDKNIPLIIEESKDAFSLINADFLKSEIDAICKRRQVILFVNENSLFESENIIIVDEYNGERPTNDIF